MRWNLARTTGNTDTYQAREGGVVAEIDQSRTPGVPISWRVVAGGEYIAQGTETDLTVARDRAQRWAASVDA